jgi:myo-inositol-1(or 4)-monophosphatase
LIPDLAELEALARGAGEILRAAYPARPGFGAALPVDYKGVIDLVTPVDLRSEAFLLGKIRERYPAHRIVSEEKGLKEAQGGDIWFVDPLDGTVNFAHGVPVFSVSIAFSSGDQMRLGVVYDPLRDECFSAERGGGAWLNGEPIRVSTATELNHSLLVTGFAYDIRSTRENNLDHFQRFALCTQGVRRMGSAALDLCSVAAGRFDGYWELSISPWDIAAGSLVAEQAGAVVTAVAGNPDYLTTPSSILAANPRIHAQMLGILNNKPAQRGAEPGRS